MDSEYKPRIYACDAERIDSTRCSMRRIAEGFELWAVVFWCLVVVVSLT